ncbi:MAG TPA: S8 family serine peptidase [Rhizomicrobium sp.]|nr:S8 family serine peptidase [Rhizomicrobium sp.]
MSLRVFLLLILALAATPAEAQLGGGRLGGLGGLPGGGILQGTLGTVNRTTGALGRDVTGAVDSVARDVVGRPLQARVLSRDPQGDAIVRGTVLAISPNAQSLAAARRLNFAVLRQDSLGSLGLNTATLSVPDGMNEADALTALRSADPSGAYDYDHIYNPSGDDEAATPAPVHAYLPVDSVRVGMIDGGIDKHHPALAGGALVIQTFAGKNDAPATQHGTAIASLLIGKDGSFSGYLPGARLFAADVFGGAPDGGSALDIARALDWLAQNHVPVTNISLAGPANALLAAAVKAFVASGHVLAAAVGNDGPAAPARFPAAYEGVFGVTSVDATGHLEIDANRNAVRFAARGIDVRAAALPRGYASVTGTSYAAPAVAAGFARLLDRPDPKLAQDAAGLLAQHATQNVEAGVPYLVPPVAALAAR